MGLTTIYYVNFSFPIFVTNSVGIRRRNDDLEAVFMNLVVTEPSSLARHIIGIGTPESSEMSPTMLESIQSSLIPEESFIPPYMMRGLSIDPSPHLPYCHEIFLDVLVVAIFWSSNVSKNTQTSFLPFLSD